VVETNAEAAKDADLVILCIPVGACGPVAQEIATHLKPGAIVSDVGSVKGAIVRDMAPYLPDGVHFVPAHPVAELMLRELADALGAMPVVLARAVEQLVRSPSRAKSSQELATMAGMTLRTLYRHLTPVGLQPRHLIVSARLLRAYIFLRSPGSRLKEVALKLGYADPSHLSEQLRVWTGLSPKEIQRTLTAAEFVQRIADHLRRVDADAEDEVEPV